MQRPQIPTPALVRQYVRKFDDGHYGKEYFGKSA